MPFPGFRHGQSGQSYGPLQAARSPRGTPPPGPHGYGASPTMGPAVLPAQQVCVGPVDSFTMTLLSPRLCVGGVLASGETRPRLAFATGLCCVVLC